METLTEVEHALEKFDGGTYGVCEVCGTEIPEARLEAKPAARHLHRLRFGAAGDPASTSSSTAASFVAVILHEISHGVVAYAYGDDTAKRAGRLTLNPIPHIDPLGSIILPAMAVLANLPVLGWAKPVPVNPSRLRNPRRQMLCVGLAGPLTNFALMVAAAIPAKIILAGTFPGACTPADVVDPWVSLAGNSWPASPWSTCSWGCSTCCRSRRSTAPR